MRPVPRKSRGKQSRFMGVTFDKTYRGRKWIAVLIVDGHVRFKGHFSTEEEAARARDEASREHLPASFARMNFPRNGERGIYE